MSWLICAPKTNNNRHNINKQALRAYADHYKIYMQNCYSVTIFLYLTFLICARIVVIFSLRCFDARVHKEIIKQHKRANITLSCTYIFQ